MKSQLLKIFQLFLLHENGEAPPKIVAIYSKLILSVKIPKASSQVFCKIL